MPNKAKPKKSVKKSKKDKGETVEEHQKEHGPDVKRLLEQYEHKESNLMEEEEFAARHAGGKTLEEEF